MGTSVLVNTTLKDYSMPNAKKLYNQALACEEAGDIEDAIQFYKSSIELDPSFVKSYQNLGSLYSRLGNRKDAYNLFLKASDISPSSETFFNLAVEEYKTDNIENAILHLKKSLEFDKRYINAHLLLANAYERSGKEEKTEIYLQNSYKINPKNKVVLSALIFFYYERNRYDETLKIIDEYSTHFPEDTRFLILKSDILSKTGSYTKSIQALGDLVNKNTDFTKQINETKQDSETKKQFEKIQKKKKNKLSEFKSKIELNKENPEDFSGPDSQDALDLSLLHLFNGEPEKAMKYLIYAQKIQNESKNT
ncbi:MAG: tetratricopeptide repeat protein [Leptospiraceae bacterium]|nr:tetratricopeptide repeat protein [Leptospiraceae bacterium]MCK6381651.1 tetratricopeptide repeat protein [Leptospiraceae bacterium]